MPIGTENLDELKEKLAPELRILMVVVSDAWGTPALADKLQEDPHMYKLRRQGNDWKMKKGR